MAKGLARTAQIVEIAGPRSSPTVESWSQLELDGLGVHCLCELYGCPYEFLNDESFVVRCLGEAAGRGMAALLNKVSHHFQPDGVTALALIAESHIAIHTWPKLGYAAIDVFTCGNRASAEAACLYLVGAFQAERHVLKKVFRGAEFPREAAVPAPIAPAERSMINPTR